MKLKLRWSDFTTVTRQASVASATHAPEIVASVAHRLLAQTWQPGQSVRLIGVGVSGLSVPLQLDLWDVRPAEEAARVECALAAFAEKFGPGKVVRGSALKPTQ